MLIVNNVIQITDTSYDVLNVIAYCFNTFLY